MINRTMVRTRVLQTLFAYYTDGECTTLQAKKNLLNSYSYTYNLYAILLMLVDELTTYAQNQITEALSRSKVTHQNFHPNRRFAGNKLAAQMFTNRQLRHIANESHLSWDAGYNALPAIYKELSQKDYFQIFMNMTKSPTYEDEQQLWRKIYTDLLPDNEALLCALEDMEISMDQQNWGTDLNVVLSYVVKTIKRFRQDNGANQPLLQMFDNEEELQFGEKLLCGAIQHHDEYEALITEHLQNWQIERVSMMDRIILIEALTEIYIFPEIAPQISMNEYIELAKEYSSNKSYIFINGILDQIIKINQSTNQPINK